MSNSSQYVQDGEFALITPYLIICAPEKLSDDEGEELYNKLEPILQSHLEVLKAKLEGMFEGIRVGYDVY